VTMLTVRSGPRTPRALCARAQERLSTRPFLSPPPPCRSPMLPPRWCMCVCVCPRPARIFTQTHILALCMPPRPPPHTTNTPTLRHRRSSTQHQHEKTEREERREKREERREKREERREKREERREKRDKSTSVSRAAFRVSSAVTSRRSAFTSGCPSSSSAVPKAKFCARWGGTKSDVDNTISLSTAASSHMGRSRTPSP
jgi:hypothetical protein